MYPRFSKWSKRPYIIGCGQEKFPILKPMAGYFFFGKRSMKWYGNEMVGNERRYNNKLDFGNIFVLLPKSNYLCTEPLVIEG